MLGVNDAPAIHAAIAYLTTVGAFYPLCFIGNTYAGLFDGMGRMQVSFVGTCSHIMMRAVLSWVFVGKFGLVAVGVATGIGWLYVCSLWEVVRRRGLRKTRTDGCLACNQETGTQAASTTGRMLPSGSES